jgi:hypothetical protein
MRSRRLRHWHCRCDGCHDDSLLGMPHDGASILYMSFATAIRGEGIQNHGGSWTTQEFMEAGGPLLSSTSQQGHYVRKIYLTRVRTKNGRVQKRFCHRVLYYKVIRDARSGASPISIHERRAMSARQLFDFWLAPMPLIRDAYCASPISKKSEMIFILARHGFNYRPGSLWH